MNWIKILNRSLELPIGTKLLIQTHHNGIKLVEVVNNTNEFLVEEKINHQESLYRLRYGIVEYSHYCLVKQPKQELDIPYANDLDLCKSVRRMAINLISVLSEDTRYLYQQGEKSKVDIITQLEASSNLFNKTSIKLSVIRDQHRVYLESLLPNEGD